MLKKSLVAALVLAAAPAFAQLPEPIEGFANPLVVGGVNYLQEKPADGASPYRFFLTANLPGFKPFAGVPLYFAGVGVDIRTLPGVGDLVGASGAGVSIPLVTYAFYGSQAVVQVGYSKAFGEQDASGVYAGVGFSLTSPNAIKAKRIAKAQAKAKKASLDAGPPAPAS